MENDTFRQPDSGTLQRLIQAEVANQLKGNLFTARKVTDTPTDNLQVVNRKYVNLNGPTTTRPTASVIGQFYLDMTLAAGHGKPIYWNGTGWIDATGTFV